jgi:hypothetical protein
MFPDPKELTDEKRNEHSGIYFQKHTLRRG